MTENEMLAVERFLTNMEKLAFEIAPPNPVTPQMVSLIVAMRHVVRSGKLEESYLEWANLAPDTWDTHAFMGPLDIRGANLAKEP